MGMEGLARFLETGCSCDISNRENLTDGCCGFGRGSGNGHGYDDCCGHSCGSRWNDCRGYGSIPGSGYDKGTGYGRERIGRAGGLKSINRNPVHIIDKLPTVITHVRGDIAQGYILKDDITLIPCYIIKGWGKFAHGSSLHEAYKALRNKLILNQTENKRIIAFADRFPEYDTPYPAADLFEWHHLLTGSCLMGRKYFCENNGIDIQKDMFTVRQFVKLTCKSYRGDIIKKIPYQYGKENKS